MCLIVFQWEANNRLVLSANRDEFFARPTAPLAHWQDTPTVIAGRDLVQQGTWLGINTRGAVAALTNVRAPGAGPKNPLSRGLIASAYLQQAIDPENYANTLITEAARYAPFNVILGDIQQLFYLTNYPKLELIRLSSGIHTLSNAQLNSPWPKALLAKNQLETWLQQNSAALETRTLAALLSRTEPFADDTLPSTGVPIIWERLLSAQLIQTEEYGTRCSTGLVLTSSHAAIHEITWPVGKTGLNEQTIKFVL